MVVTLCQFKHLHPSKVGFGICVFSTSLKTGLQLLLLVKRAHTLGSCNIMEHEVPVRDTSANSSIQNVLKCLKE